MLPLLHCLHSSNCQGSRNVSCRPDGLCCGNFPAVLRSSGRGGAAPWAPALIWRWEADMLAPLLAARVPRPAIYGAKIQRLRTCTAAWGPGDTASGEGVWSQGGGARWPRRR